MCLRNIIQNDPAFQVSLTGALQYESVRRAKPSNDDEDEEWQAATAMAQALQDNIAATGKLDTQNVIARSQTTKLHSSAPSEFQGIKSTESARLVSTSPSASPFDFNYGTSFSNGGIEVMEKLSRSTGVTESKQAPNNIEAKDSDVSETKAVNGHAFAPLAEYSTQQLMEELERRQNGQS